MAHARTTGWAGTVKRQHFICDPLRRLSVRAARRHTDPVLPVIVVTSARAKIAAIPIERRDGADQVEAERPVSSKTTRALTEDVDGQLRAPAGVRSGICDLTFSEPTAFSSRLPSGSAVSVCPVRR